MGLNVPEIRRLGAFISHWMHRGSTPVLSCRFCGVQSRLAQIFLRVASLATKYSHCPFYLTKFWRLVQLSSSGDRLSVYSQICCFVLRPVDIFAIKPGTFWECIRSGRVKLHAVLSTALKLYYSFTLHQLCTLGKISRKTFDRGLGLPQNLSGREGKEKSPYPCLESNSVVHPVASKYNDWAIHAGPDAWTDISLQILRRYLI
jgi:hypothetical protein